MSDEDGPTTIWDATVSQCNALNEQALNEINNQLRTIQMKNTEIPITYRGIALSPTSRLRRTEIEIFG